jgi:hypothetical protein
MLTSALASKSIDEILRLPDVQERTAVYRAGQDEFIDFLKQRTKTDGKVICFDSRGSFYPPPGNRFLLYTLFPQQNISLSILDGKEQKFAVITVGYSIINKSATADVGSIMLQYGGGGHKQVGTCQVPYLDVDRVAAEIVSRLNGEAGGLRI